MKTMVEAKICGLSTPETVDAAVRFGARWVGFVTYPRSPRHVAANDLLKALGARVPTSVGRVGLFVDPDDALLDERLATGAIDMLQLHGAETPERVATIKAHTGKPVMKVIKVGPSFALVAFPTTTLAVALPLVQTVASRVSITGVPNFFLSADVASVLSVPPTA